MKRLMFSLGFGAGVLALISMWHMFEWWFNEFEIDPEEYKKSWR